MRSAGSVAPDARRSAAERQSHVAVIAPPRAPPTGPTEVAVDAATAKKHDLSRRRPHQDPVPGTAAGVHDLGHVGFGEADNLVGATLAAFDTATAQKVLDRRASSTRSTSSRPTACRRRTCDPSLRCRAARRASRRSPAPTAPTKQATARCRRPWDSSGTAFLVFAFIALFVGAFIIFNTFTIIVTQRTREIGAAAGDRGQPPAGDDLGRGRGVRDRLDRLGAGHRRRRRDRDRHSRRCWTAFGVDLPSTSIQLEPRTIVVSFVVGTVVTVVSSILPARRASRVRADPGAPRVGGQRQRVPATPI